MSQTSDRKRPEQRRPKFSVQQTVEDFTSKISRVINHTVCAKHGAHRHGQPCWWIRNDDGYPRAAICNNRAAMIYTGTPTERASMNHREYKRLQKEKTA